MGSFDGAETCELVGLYMLSQLEKLGINIGLYRDDGLATCNKTARETENIKKEICKIFEENKLNITIEANKKNYRLPGHYNGLKDWSAQTIHET